MATGYFKLYRPLQDHWIYKDSRYIHLWLECLINARWSAEPKTDVYKGVMYKLFRGQFLFSRNTYSERLGIDEATVRRCVDLMVKDNMLEKVMSIGKNKPTIYQVVNFDKYNAPTEPSEHTENSGVEDDLNPVATQSKPSGDPVATAKEESNKGLKKKTNLYTSIFNYYLELDLIKHKSLNDDMRKAIDKATKELNLDEEYFKRIITRHKVKVDSTKDSSYPIKLRSLSELFGQKKHGSVSLICTDYLDEVWEGKTKSEPKQQAIDKSTLGERSSMWND